MKILVTGVGGPTPRSFAIALKKFGKGTYHLIATDSNPLAYGLYARDLFDHSYVVPKASDPAYWPSIQALVETHGIDCAVVMPELEVIEWSRREAEGNLPCTAFLPQAELAALLYDKAAMTNVIAPAGLAPASVSFHRNEVPFDELFAKLGQQIWVRSSSGTSGLGSLLVRSADELRNWILINPGVTQFLASPFLSGRNLACKLLYNKGKLVRSACAERVQYIMAKVAPSGITGNTSFGRLLNEPALVERATAAMDLLFAATGATPHGFFTVDFKEDAEGRPYVTEVNVRHVAFTQCFAAGGANLAEDSVRLLVEDPSFDHAYQMYRFAEGLIFLRDVDVAPVLMSEKDLLAALSGKLVATGKSLPHAV